MASASKGKGAIGPVEKGKICYAFSEQANTHRRVVTVCRATAKSSVAKETGGHRQKIISTESGGFSRTPHSLN